MHQIELVVHYLLKIVVFQLLNAALDHPVQAHSVGKVEQHENIVLGNLEDQ